MADIFIKKSHSHLFYVNVFSRNIINNKNILTRIDLSLNR